MLSPVMDVLLKDHLPKGPNSPSSVTLIIHQCT